MAGIEDTLVLEARRVSKTFSGTVALDAVDFRLARGSVHALIGENGAGKSTLLKILAGIEQPTSGGLALDGQDTRFGSARDAARHGVGIIHQELQLFPDLTVTENLFVGRERRTRWGTVASAVQTGLARDVLRSLGQSLSPETHVGTLPLGQQQMVEIARAVVHDARVLLMDEPTSALGASEVPVLFRLIRDLVSRGVSVVYVSHRLEELLAIADHVTVLRDGRVAGDDATSAVDVRWIVERMTGRGAAGTASPFEQASGPTLLTVEGLQLGARPGRSALHDVSFEIRAGEIVGLYGLMGAGRSELLESLLGVHRDATGRVRLNGRDLNALDVSRRVDAGLAMVPEDRQAAGLVPAMSVRDNLTLSSLGRLSRFGYLSPATETRSALTQIDELAVKTSSPGAPVGALSGGNQQKVVIGRAVMSRPKVLLMDEPTRGVDVAAKSEILDSMRRLAAEGLGIVFATSDLAEVQAAATRVLVMARGRIAADVPADGAAADALASAASTAPAGAENR